MTEETKKKNLIKPLIVIVLVGLIAGGVGELLTRTYLLDSAYNVPLFGDINYSDSNRSNLVIQQANKVLVQQNDKVLETANSVMGSLVAIYKKQQPVATSKYSLDNFYDLSNLQGQGLAVTSDGWVITNLGLLSESNVALSDFVAVAGDKKAYSIDQIIPDKSSKLYFIHIAANDLPVVKFAARTDVNNGQIVLAVGLNNSTLVTSIINDRFTTSTVSFSDDFNDEIVLSQKIDRKAELVLFDLAGQVVGLVDETGKVISASHLDSSLAGTLKTKSIKKASLGVYYVSMFNLAQLDPKVTDLPLNNKGALIVNSLNNPAIVKGGSADLAGLKAGDLILSVNDFEINQSTSLTDAIQAYLPGDKVTISYQRNGIKNDVVAKLTEVK